MNEVLKSNVITNEERRDNGNGWDSGRCVDVFGGKKGLTCYQYDAKYRPIPSRRIYQRG